MSASNNSLEEETLEFEISRENGSRPLVLPGSSMHIALPNDAIFNSEAYVSSESSVSDEIYEPYTDNPTEISASAPLLCYTSFEGPHFDGDDDRCGLSDDDYEGIYKGPNKYAFKLWCAILLSSIFFVCELVGGLISGSLALLSDSFHLLSDVVSFAISLLSIYLARRPATKSLSYGYHRAEILGALISVFIIWGLTGYLVMEAIERLKNPHEIDGKTMCLIAAIGVGVNVVLMLILREHGHDHNFNHNHGNNHNHDQILEEAPCRNQGSINVSAAMLHVLGDLLSSIGVLISAIVIMVSPDKVWVDPICTFAFSALVIATTFSVLRSGIRILMEGTPSHIDCHAVRQDLANIEGVKNIHDLHIWELTVGRASLTAHIRLHQHDPDIHSSPPSPAKILQQARYLLKKKYNLSHVTIQIDG